MAEDDQSIVIRMYDMEGTNSEVTLQSDFKFKEASHTNLIEEEIKEIPYINDVLKVKVGRYAIETIKLKL